MTALFHLGAPVFGQMVFSHPWQILEQFTNTKQGMPNSEHFYIFVLVNGEQINKSNHPGLVASQWQDTCTTDKQPLAITFTPKDNFVSDEANVRVFGACRRKPNQAKGEHATMPPMTPCVNTFFFSFCFPVFYHLVNVETTHHVIIAYNNIACTF